jgi:hypothetical protein
LVLLSPENIDENKKKGIAVSRKLAWNGTV